MANGFIPAVQRFSQFLRQERELQRRRRTERILTQLPDLIQKEFSGITTEKEVYSKLPQITGKLYAYGPEVGQMATQIATTIAQTKLNELQAGRLEKQRGEQKDALFGLYGNIEIDDKGTTIAQKYGQSDLSPETLGQIIPGEVNLNRRQFRSVVSKTPKGIVERVYSTDKTGRYKTEREYEVDEITQLGDDPATPEDEKYASPEIQQYFEQERLRKEQERNLLNRMYARSDAKPLETTNVITSDGKFVVATKLQGVGTVEVTDPQSGQKVKQQRPMIQYYDKDGNILDVERELGTGLYATGLDEIKTAELNKVDQDKYRSLQEAGEIVSTYKDDFEDYLEDDPVMKGLKVTPVDRLTKRLNQEIVHETYRRLLAEKEPEIISMKGTFNPETIKPSDIDRMVKKEIFTEKQGEFLKVYVTEYLKKEKQYQDVLDKYKMQIPGLSTDRPKL